MSSSSTGLPTPEGPGSVSGAPNLPAGFTDTFTSRYVDTGELRLHAVMGGEGPPLLLVHGRPESWYAWRLLMPALARDFEVIAVDQRGMGLSDKPAGGYDTGRLAGDLVALMDALGHERFAVGGHDTGFAIGYALAADYPDRVDRIALLEVPGSPGTVQAPPAIPPRAAQRAALAPRLQPDRQAERTARRGTGGRPSTAGSSTRPPRASPTTRSTTTSACSPTLTPCVATSAGTGARYDHRTGRAAQDPAADDSPPRDRRRGKLR
jgi:pimeloyl-ACP methyl ester carboxylesterase